MPLQIVNQNLITAYRLYRDLDLLNILRLDRLSYSFPASSVSKTYFSSVLGA